jgi:hypothetical protein
MSQVEQFGPVSNDISLRRSQKASRIKVTTAGHFEQTNSRDNHFRWLVGQAEKFQAVFPKSVKESIMSAGGFVKLHDGLFAPELVPPAAVLCRYLCGRLRRC